jgi:hypothetical protein
MMTLTGITDITDHSPAAGKGPTTTIVWIAWRASTEMRCAMAADANAARPGIEPGDMEPELN